MRRDFHRVRAIRRGFAAAAVIGGLVLTACGEDRTIAWDQELTSIRVEIVQGDRGTPDSRLQLGGGGQPFTVNLAYVSGADGTVMARSGWVRLSARPGTVSLGQAQNVNGQDVYLQDGRATGIQVSLLLPFGPTHIWAEDAGYLPPTGSPSGCSDQMDNDGDGLTDYPFDPGCFSSLDDSEEAGTLAAGVSETVWYANPTISQVQGNGAKVSPFQGETVTITSGDIIVTQVASDGMYVTDISKQDGTSNSMYVYNYNTPAHVRVCDRLTNLSGIVSEFYKFTEMNFPSWDLEPWYEPAVCPVREPHTLTAAELKNSTTMEGFESSLVRVENVQLGNKDCQDADPNDGVCWCDLDGNGSVDVIPYDAGAVCSDECACRKTCENNALCTERAQFIQFKQWVVSVGGQRLFIVSSETAPDFDPFAPGTPTQIRSITGTLRNMSFLKPAWILEPRCSDDIVLAGDPPPTNTTCVYPRTGEEDDEY